MRSASDPGWLDPVRILPNPSLLEQFRRRRLRSGRGARRDLCCRRVLDRHADEAAVLGPAAIVVPDALVAEQLVEDEPRVARPLADPAVRDDVLVGRDALALVEGGQLLAALEGAVLAHGLRPRDRCGAGDVPCTLCGLAHAGRGDDLAVELGRAAHVDERETRIADPRQDVVAERTKAEVVRKIRKDLESTGVNILGVVLNKKKNYIPDYLEKFL